MGFADIHYIDEHNSSVKHGVINIGLRVQNGKQFTE